MQAGCKKQERGHLFGVLLIYAYETKNAALKGGILYCRGIRWRAQPCWNADIWYKRTHGTEYR